MKKNKFILGVEIKQKICKYIRKQNLKNEKEVNTQLNKDYILNIMKQQLHVHVEMYLQQVQLKKI